MTSPSAPAGESGAKGPWRLPSAAWAGACLLALSALALIPAVYYMMTGFIVWDDEGALMLSVKQYLEGGKLYTEMATAYGPVYYFYNRLLHALTGSPVSHDVTRLTSAVLLVVCALVCAAAVYRVTRSLPIAAVAHVLAWRSLAFFHNEPGHPQELCMLLLLLFVSAGIWAGHARRQAIGMALVGAIAAALLLIKVNIGIFAITAAGLAILYSLPANLPVRLLRTAAAAAGVAMPFLLMRAHLNDPAEAYYCLAVTAGAAALVAGPLRRMKPALTFRDAWIALAGFTAATGAVLLGLMAQGTTLRSAFVELVLVNVRGNIQMPYWFLPAKMGWAWAPWALAGVVLAAATTQGAGRLPGSVRWAMPGLQAGFGAVALALLFAGQGAMGFIPPFCWLLAVVPGAGFGRLLLAGTAVFQTLYAYPLAGSQAVFVRVPLMMVGAVALSDGLRALPALRPWEGRAWRLARAGGAILVILAAECYISMAYHLERAYAADTPLNLPGATRLRLPREQALAYRWLAANLERQCDSFVGMPGLPSLYFWTGQAPPGALHESPGRLWMDDWLYGLTAGEQQRIVNALAKYPNACAVHAPALVSFWNKGKIDLSGLPLVNYINAEFRTAGRVGFRIEGEAQDFDFLVRKGRQVELTPAK